MLLHMILLVHSDNREQCIISKFKGNNTIRKSIGTNVSAKPNQLLVLVDNAKLVNVNVHRQ